MARRTADNELRTRQAGFARQRQDGLAQMPLAKLLADPKIKLVVSDVTMPTWWFLWTKGKYRVALNSR